MMTKIIVPILFLAAQFCIAWYGNFTGKLADHGTILGINYNSPIVKSILIQFKFFWLLVIINALFSLGFTYGFSSYRSFLTLSLIWLAAGPLAAFIFNGFVLKEPFDWPMIAGALLIFAGAVAVVAHKEIAAII